MTRSCIVGGAFDLARYGTCTINFTDDAGATSVDLTEATYDHDELLDDCGITSLTAGSLGDHLAVRMNSVSVEDYTVTFNRATGKYTIATATSAVFSITWTGAPGERLRSLLGFIANCSGATSYTSSHVPLYAMVPTSAGPSEYPGPWEEKGHRKSIRSSAGQPYRLGPATVPFRTLFMFEYEPRSHVDRAYRTALASVGHLYTWEQMWEDFGRDALLPLAIEMVGAEGLTERLAFDLATEQYDETTHKPRAKNDHVRWTVTLAALLRQSETDATLPAHVVTDGNAPPVNTIAPVASGAVTIGGSLTCTDGTWTGDPTIVYTYQWQRAATFDGGGSFANIGGATASGYTPVVADIGYDLRRAVTGTNGAGASTAYSNALIYNPTTVTAVYEVFKIRPLTPGAIAAFVGSKAGVSLAQGTGAARPTANATSFGGQPGLFFDGGDQLSGTVALGTEASLRVVMAMLDSTSTVSVPMELGPGYNTNDGSFVMFVNAASGSDVSIGSRGTVGPGATGATESLAAACVISFCVTTGNADGGTFIRKNTVALALTPILSTCAAGNYTQTTLYLGQRSASLPWTGYLGGAIIIMTGSAQNGDLADAEAYVKNGAGL